MDSVKFRFVEKQLVTKVKNTDIELENITKSLFKSDKELLDEVLINDNYLHSKQLQYLAKNHKTNILKIRFITQPFSFVFLLEGTQQYHIVLETVNTKEATYIWHISKETTLLDLELSAINSFLNIIKRDGRQAFLKTNTKNFSRILHNYSNDKKSYYQWKNSLESLLF